MSQMIFSDKNGLDLFYIRHAAIELYLSIHNQSRCLHYTCLNDCLNVRDLLQGEIYTEFFGGNFHVVRQSLVVCLKQIVVD